MSPSDVKIALKAMNIENIPKSFSQASESLAIVVHSTSGERTTFEVKKHTDMKQVVKAFAHEKNLNEMSLRFLCNGARIGTGSTPGSLGMEDNDVVDVFMEQQGGVTGSGSRVRMPHNNRVSSSVSMKMTDIWTNTIGYDPYAAEGEAAKKAVGQEETMERAKGIMALAKISNAAQGSADRSTDFSRQVFWGLKRRAPPKGYEVPVLSSDDESDDDSDSSSDSGDEKAGAAVKAKTEKSRIQSPSPESSEKRKREDSSRRGEGEQASSRSHKKEKKDKKEKKEKKERKERKREKKEKKHKKDKKKRPRKESE
jgi:hypothetical protein